MDEMKEGRTTWLDGRIVICGKEKKGNKRKQETKRKGRAKCDGPAWNPSAREAEAERLPIQG